MRLTPQSDPVFTHWTDGLSEAELLTSFELWKDAKRESGETSDLSFEEWLEMEKAINLSEV